MRKQKCIRKVDRNSRYGASSSSIPNAVKGSVNMGSYKERSKEVAKIDRKILEQREEQNNYFTRGRNILYTLI